MRMNPTSHPGYLTVFTLWLIVAALAASGTSALAVSLSINTASLAGQPGRLDFQLLDGDLSANNSVTIAAPVTNGTLQGFDCSIGCAGGPPFVLSDGLGFGELLQDLLLGTALSIMFNTTNSFAGGDADLLVLNLLNPATNFSLVNTNLDALAAPVPYQDALFVFNLATGQLLTASSSTPLLPISSVPEAASGSLLLLGASSIALARLIRRFRRC